MNFDDFSQKHYKFIIYQEKIFMTLIGIKKEDAVPVFAVFTFDPLTSELVDIFSTELYINDKGVEENPFATRISADTKLFKQCGEYLYYFIIEDFTMKQNVKLMRFSLITGEEEQISETLIQEEHDLKYQGNKDDKKQRMERTQCVIFMQENVKASHHGKKKYSDNNDIEDKDEWMDDEYVILYSPVDTDRNYSGSIR